MEDCLRGVCIACSPMRVCLQVRCQAQGATTGAVMRSVCSQGFTRANISSLFAGCGPSAGDLLLQTRRGRFQGLRANFTVCDRASIIAQPAGLMQFLWSSMNAAKPVKDDIEKGERVFSSCSYVLWLLLSCHGFDVFAPF